MSGEQLLLVALTLWLTLLSNTWLHFYSHTGSVPFHVAHVYKKVEVSRGASGGLLTRTDSSNLPLDDFSARRDTMT